MQEERLPGKTLPHNEEAERALLGALLLDSERVAEVGEVVEARDFFNRRHAILFETLVAIAERNVPIDFISVGEALEAKGSLREVGGLEYLGDLTASVTSSAHSTHHAQIVSDTACLRGLIREATEIVSQAYDTRPDGESVKRLLDDSEQRIFGLARREEGTSAEPIAKAITETFRRIDASTHRGGLTGLPTGFVDLDQKLCGLNAGELIVIAGRPSMGKTAFGLNIIENAARSQPDWINHKPVVLFFSLEMGRQQVVSRMLCSHARVDAHRLRSGRLPPEDRAELTQAADELRHQQIYIDDSSGLTMMSMRSRARRLMSRIGALDLIVIDYLQLLSFPRSEGRQQEISNISRSLKGLAREMNVPVVALAQLSRAVELRDPPRPQLADLRESGSIEQDADVVLLLYRPEYYPKFQTEENRGLAEVICAKQRNGPTGLVRLQFFDTSMRFENRAPGVAEPISF
ncbi:MAG: replicative DNA helicase [Planctomycetota bacterium]|nr:replicative DNA helicase [Planctomycetota bacterium]